MNVSQRITSTYVEKTYFLTLLPYLAKDHLHIRGENRLLVQVLLCGVGSPPHTWRKQIFLRICDCDYGITSTYVEKTLNCQVRHLEQWDHLHIRGENAGIHLI